LASSAKAISYQVVGSLNICTVLQATDLTYQKFEYTYSGIGDVIMNPKYIGTAHGVTLKK